MKKKSASKSAFFKLRVLVGVSLCFGAVTLVLFALGRASGQSGTDERLSGSTAPQVQRQNPYSDAWLAANHGKYDNIWTAEYETRLQQAALGASMPANGSTAPQVQRQNPYSAAWLAANHGKYENTWTAEYETRLQQAAEPVLSDLLNVLTPNYGPDVRMSNGNVLGSGQNEFQIDVNPLDNLNAIGNSNDGPTAGVSLFRTTDGDVTWTSRDASA